MAVDKFEQYYLEHQDESGKLSEEQMAQMLTGDLTGDSANQGDTVEATESDEAPAVAANPEPDVVEEAKPEPTVLAKDGEHTIPYEKLQEARDAAKYWEQQAKDTAEQVAALTKAKDPEAKPESTATEDIFGDYSEQALANGVEKLVGQRVAALEQKFADALAPMQKSAEEQATAAHFKTIYDAHPDTDQIVKAPQLNQWIDAQPSFLRDQCKAVLERGNAEQVVELFTAFKASTVQPAAVLPAKEDLAGKAAAVIAKTKSVAPTSLSNVPAGSAAHHDEAAAMREMSGMTLMDKFHGKTPQQIMDLMSRVI